MSTTKAKEAEKTRTRGETRTEPPWNAILHNDWENSATQAVYVLVRVTPGMTIKRATKIMWEAHTTERRVAKTCHKKLAKLYEEHLRAKGLTVSIEPAR